MGKLTESLGAASRVRRVIALQIDPVALSASAVMREGVVVEGALVPTTGDTRIDVPPQAAAVQLSQPIGDVVAAAGITSEQLLSMTFLDLVVALFDPHT